MTKRPVGRVAIAPSLGAQASCRLSVLLSWAFKSGQGRYSPPRPPGTQGELGGRPPPRLSAARASFGAAHGAGPSPLRERDAREWGRGELSLERAHAPAALRGLQGPPERLMERIPRLT